MVVCIAQALLECADTFDHDDASGLDDVPLLQLAVDPVHALIARRLVTQEWVDHVVAQTIEVVPLPWTGCEVVGRDDLAAQRRGECALACTSGAVDSDQPCSQTETRASERITRATPGGTSDSQSPSARIAARTSAPEISFSAPSSSTTTS